MRVLRSPSQVSRWTRRHRREGVTIGFVPTMGALHAGHRSLIRAARLTCDAVVVSIFVNPAQFGPREDLAHYPRPFRADLELCRKAGVDLVFAPSVGAIYPPGFGTEVRVPALAARWEGAARPHHFPGVATVVTKLLAIVQPDRAYFGQKDYQQCAIVRHLVADLNLATQIVVRPTVREADGLALSSRNVYLTPAQRRAAPLLYRALRTGAQVIQSGTRTARNVEAAMRRVCQAHPMVSIEYVSVCDPDTLEPLRRINGSSLLLGAIRVGPVRLIDNLLVRAPRPRPRR